MPSANRLITPYCCLLIMLGISALTIVTPALPIIHKTLDTSDTIIKLSLITYLGAYALTQLVYGPLSDHYGRKPVIVVAHIIFLLGSSISALSGSGEGFLIGHIIAGAGAGVGSCVPRAMLRDVYSGKQFTHALAYLLTASAVGAALSPFLGGWLLHLFGWEAVIYFIMVINVFILIISPFIPETNTKPKKLNVQATGKLFWFLMKKRHFLGNALFSGLLFGAATSYLTITPFLYQNQLNLTPAENGSISVLFLISLIIGTYLFKKILINISNEFAAVAGLITIAFAALFMLFTGIIDYLATGTLLVPGILIYLSTGVAAGAVTSSALSPYSEIAGTASALQVSLKIFATTVCGVIVAFIDQTTQLPLGYLLLGIAACTVTSFFYASFKQNRKKS